MIRLQIVMMPFEFKIQNFELFSPTVLCTGVMCQNRVLNKSLCLSINDKIILLISTFRENYIMKGQKQI